LSSYQGRASAPLAEIAVMLGLPGKLGMDGSEVWGQYQQGKIAAIRDYCETDVLNTYLIYLQWELFRGNLDKDGWKQEVRRVRDALKAENKAHFRDFLAAWPE
jgi:predicted PolB exonuclease-like 3'-5' exonuclease